MARSAIVLAASGSFDAASTFAARSSPLGRRSLACFTAFGAFGFLPLASAAFTFAAPSARAASALIRGLLALAFFVVFLVVFFDFMACLLLKTGCGNAIRHAAGSRETIQQPATRSISLSTSWII